MDKKNIELIHAPLPYPIYPIGYEGSLTQTEAMGQFQAKLNEIIDSYNSLINTFPNVVQEEGNSATDVMSQAATTVGLSKKLDKSDVTNEVGSSTSKAASQALVTSETNRLTGLTTEKIPKSDIVQTTGSAENKVMSQKAVSDAVSGAVSKIENDFTRTSVKIYKDGSGWSATKSFSEVVESLSHINWKYYYYPNSLAEGNYCEILPGAYDGNSIKFLGIANYQILSEGRVTTLAPVLITWHDSGSISVVNRVIGVDDVQMGNKESTTLAPSSRYLNTNFDKGIHTGAFTLTISSSRIIQMSGGALSTANTISFTITTDFDDTVSGKVNLKFIIGAVLETNTNIHIYNGINRITVRRSVEGLNVWEIINCSEKGIAGQCVKLNTSIGASAATYNNWVFGFTPAPPTTASITVSSGYSY